MNQIQIYTDGGCHGNPGPGAWAFVLVTGETTVERAGSDPSTTNNRMELQAVISGLREASRRSQDGAGIVVVTDSQYVKNGISSWIHTWIRNGWRTSNKTAVKNKELWVALHELSAALKPTWKWVRGHSGDALNERCDQLVQQAIADIE